MAATCLIGQLELKNHRKKAISAAMFSVQGRRPPKPIPHRFVLECLVSVDPYTRPMFGCTSVYIGEKIFFILREKDSYPRDNGVWIATTEENHASLKSELPCMRSISLFGETSTWQNLPSDSQNFEETVIRACELVLARDPRIGKIPNSRRALSKKRNPSTR